MKYIDVLWKHRLPNEPVRLVSELDVDRQEVRKLEFFANGHVGFASADTSACGTRLGECAIPPLEEINRDPQFVGVSINATQFESLWRQHAHEGT